MWRIFYEQYYELPVGYNAFQSAHLAGRLQWSKVHMLHDMSAHRSLVISSTRQGYGRLLQNLTQAAWSMMRRTFGLGLDKYGTMQFLVARAGRHARADGTATLGLRAVACLAGTMSTDSVIPLCGS